MTDYEIKLPGELLSSLMSDNTGFAQLIGSVLNQVLEAQATEQIGSDRYERNADRGPVWLPRIVPHFIGA